VLQVVFFDVCCPLTIGLLATEDQDARLRDGHRSKLGPCVADRYNLTPGSFLDVEYLAVEQFLLVEAGEDKDLLLSNLAQTLKRISEYL
jgi:hypothetical protein